MHVRFGSKADMCVAKYDVRSTPNSDKETSVLGVRCPEQARWRPFIPIRPSIQHCIACRPSARSKPIIPAPHRDSYHVKHAMMLCAAATPDVERIDAIGRILPRVISANDGFMLVSTAI